MKMSKIKQFRNVVQDVKHITRYVGLDENDVPIYDRTKNLPKIKFTGTVKLHGTNASVCLENDEIFAQSKTNKLTGKTGHYGFVEFVKLNKVIFKDMLNNIVKELAIDVFKNSIAIFGEWAGESIQKNVAISKLPKAFYIFGIKIKPNDENKESYWVNHNSKILRNLSSVKNGIYNIYNFKTFEVMVDFENPKYAQKEFENLTLDVEKMCPVSKELGVEGIGEGIVWVGEYVGNRFTFKTKGDKHVGNRMTRNISKEDPIIIQEKKLLADKVTPDWRLEQFINQMFNYNNGGELDIKQIGNYIKTVTSDILEEDLDIISESSFEYNDIKKYINKNIVNYFNMLIE